MKKQFIILISVLLFALVLCGAASANGGLDNVYVATDGNDSWDGSSPTPGPGNVGPLQSIEMGITRAYDNGTVHLAAGTYNKTESGHSDIGLSIAKNMTLSGAGSGVTFIDAMGLSQIFSIGDVRVIIKDLIMKNGLGDYGGAINNQGTLTVTNCAFENNHATTKGGAIFSGMSSSLYVTGSNFTANTATDNGAIHIEGASFRIIGNNFIYNNGSGIYIYIRPTGAGPISYRDINVNRIVGNTDYGVYLDTGKIPIGVEAGAMEYGTGPVTEQLPGYMVDATNNWWGSNDNPKNNPDNIGGNVFMVDADPWLILTISANPTSVPFGSTSTITASVTTNSNGQDTSGIGHIPDGILIKITTDIGNVGSKSVDVGTVNGIATALLRANEGWGTAHLYALLDGFWTPVPAQVVITQAASTTTTAKTVGMQSTGAPLAVIVLALLMVMGGILSTRKK